MAADLVQIDATVGDAELVRFVEIWVDGVPVAIADDPPYQARWDASGEAAGGEHFVRVIARPLHASRTLGCVAEARVTIE